MMNHSLEDDVIGHGGSATAKEPPRMRSCLRCKRRKQRCDKLLPGCTPCQKSGLECTGMLQETQERRGVVTVLLEHVAALEAELELQAANGQQTRHRAGRCHSPSLPSSAREQNSEEQAADLDVLFSTTSAAANAGPNGDSSMNHLSLSAVAEPRNRAEEFLKHLSTPRLITGVTETFGGNPESTGRVDQLWEAISQYIRRPSSSVQRLYIPHDETSKALDTYLEVVDFRYPRLAVDKVRSGMSAISTQDGDRAYKELISTRPAHIFMAYLVMAIVPLVNDSCPISQGSWVSAHLLSKCLELINRVFLQEDGVDIIQCLHLLVILSIHCSTAGSSWHLVGFALNKCIALGYHREEPRIVATLSDSDAQQRRWAFWGCYLLDRLICAGLGRPFSIEDEDISVPLPSDPSESTVHSTPQGTTPASTSTLHAHAHIHLFRYAILLSAATRDRAITTESDDTAQLPGFDHLLGQALYWRSTSPIRGKPSMADIHSHQMSLYNTLILRVAIRELKSGYVLAAPGPGSRVSIQDALSVPQQAFLRHKIVATDGENGEPGLFPVPSSAVLRLFRHEMDRLQRMNLVGICRAVARSLDRSRMTSRPYLSFLTGYSSLSMGLACLYQLTVFQFARSCEPDLANFPFLSDAAVVDAAPSQGPTFDTRPSSPSAIDSSGQRSSSGRTFQDSEQRLYADPQALVDLACRKLEVAGRQFPRLQEYRMILEKLRALVCFRSRRCDATAERPSIHDQIAEFRQITKVIGPPHLRILAEAILYLLAL